MLRSIHPFSITTCWTHRHKVLLKWRCVARWSRHQFITEPRWVKQPLTHTHTPTHTVSVYLSVCLYIVPNSPQIHVFGLWGESVEAGENPHRHAGRTCNNKRLQSQTGDFVVVRWQCSPLHHSADPYCSKEPFGKVFSALNQCSGCSAGLKTRSIVTHLAHRFCSALPLFLSLGCGFQLRLSWAAYGTVSL